MKDKEKCIVMAKKAFTVFVAFGAVRTVDFLGKHVGYAVGRMSFMYLFLICIFCTGIWKLLKGNRRRITFSVLFGTLFSCGIIFGSLIQTRHSVFMGPESKIKLLLYVFFLAVPLASIFDLLCDLLGRCGKAGEKRLSRKCFAGSVFFVIFVAWIPVWLAFYPAIYAYDSMLQRHVYMHMGLWSNQQPLIHTLFIDVCWNIGLALGGTNETGMAMYALVQMAILDGAITYALLWLYEKQSRGIVLMILWFACFPVHPILAISVTKDTLFAAFVLMFVVHQFRCMEKKTNWKDTVMIVFLMVIMLMFRNNTIYALGVAAIVTFFLMRKKRRYYAAVVIVSVCIAKIGEFAMISATDAAPAPTVEKFCLPFQQMARVGRDADLNAVSDYISYEATLVYSETFADPVKWRATEEMFDDLGTFLGTWIKVGFKYPSLYLDAFIANTAGYWYIDDTMVAQLYFLQTENINPGDGVCDVERTTICPKVYEKLYGLFEKNEYLQKPLLGTLCSIAIYIWILIFYVIYMIYRKMRQLLIPATFLLAYLLTLFMGPCVLVRYAYLMMLTAPVLIAVLMENGGEKGTIRRNG